MRKRDNRGVSLIEIMVVVAILSLVSGVGVWGLNTLSGKPAQQCAQKVIYSLEKHRTTAMGKVEAYYILRKDASTGKIVCEEGVKNSSDDSVPYTKTISEVGTKQVSISYVTTGDAVIDLPSGGELKFVFDRGSGAFKKDGFPCKKLILKSGGHEVDIKLVQLTGKVYLD